MIQTHPSKRWRVPVGIRVFFWMIHFLFFWSIRGVILAFVGFMMLYKGYLLDLPDVTALKDYRSPTITKIYSPEGEEVSRYARQNRIVVSIDEIPDHIINAFLAAEDKRFFEHTGVDPVSLVRAVLQNLSRSSGQRLVGASTITQQVAKVFFTEGEKTLDRKIKEALLAFELERKLTKDEILELYLNEIFFGLNSYGIAAAGLRYFGKELNEITISEAAFLASLPKGPNNYNPVRNNARATDRRDWVIGRMLNNGFISEWEAWSAAKEVLPDNIAEGYTQQAGDYFTDQVRRELLLHFGETKVFEEGLTVQTTVEKELNVIARNALRAGLEAYDRRHGWRGTLGYIDVRQGDWRQQLEDYKRPKDIGDWQVAIVTSAHKNSAKVRLQGGEIGHIPLWAMEWALSPWRKGQKLGTKKTYAYQVLKPGDVILVKDTGSRSTAGATLFSLQQIPNVNGALVAINPKDGHILALAGGYSFATSQFNRASQAKRQPGSTFKPFVYLAGLNRGYKMNSVIKDEQFTITFDTGESWTPKNAGGSYWGSVAFSRALETSRNVPTVRIARDVGMRYVTELAQLFGVSETMPNHLANALGSWEVSLLDMAGAYAMLANEGALVIPTTIRTVKDRYGRTIFDSKNGLCISCLSSSSFIRRNAHHLPSATQVYSEKSIEQLRSILRGVIERGTGKKLAPDLPSNVVGKTGTTNNNHDAWFMGYTPDLAVGVFVGFDNPRSLGENEEGSTVAGPIFRDFLNDALDALKKRDPEFKTPVREVINTADVIVASAEPKKKKVKKKVVKKKRVEKPKQQVAQTQDLFGFQIGNSTGYNTGYNSTPSTPSYQATPNYSYQQPVQSYPTYSGGATQSFGGGGGIY